MTSTGLTGTLRARREHLGVTQSELARRLGTKQPRISRWECGARGIGLNTLIRWAEALGLKVTITLEEEDDRA